MHSLDTYTFKIAGYDRDELIDELRKLESLSRAIYQEYADRAETLHLLASQKDKVIERLSDYEDKTF